MRIILVCLISCLLFSCSNKEQSDRKHIYHTYYGTIDTDTLDALVDKDGSLMYVILRYETKRWFAHAAGANKAWVSEYYNPTHNRYFSVIYDDKGYVGPRCYYRMIGDSICQDSLVGDDYIFTGFKLPFQTLDTLIKTGDDGGRWNFVVNSKKDTLDWWVVSPRNDTLRMADFIATRLGCYQLLMSGYRPRVITDE